MKPTGGWDAGKIERAAKHAAFEESEIRLRTHSTAAMSEFTALPEPDAPVVASRLSFLGKLKYLIQVGPKGAILLVGRKSFRLPVVGHVLRTLSLVVRLPIVLRRIVASLQEAQEAWQQINDVTVPVLRRAIDQAERNREIGLEELTRIVGQVEQRARDADQVLRAGILELCKAHDTTQQTLVDLRRLISKLSRKQVRLAVPQTESSAAASPADVVAGDEMAAFYVAFEDKFRGPREQVKQWQGEYLSRVADAVKATGGTILDVGCGRGEWLELLKERGFSARGVDLNDVAAQECRQLGLDVTTGDALAVMHGIPANSLAVVSAFHVIEHLSLPILFAFLDEAMRALKPGGIVILETPNPGNLQVGAHKFWLDLTHLRPLPSETVAFVVESRGFADVEALPMHPNNQAADRYDDPLLNQLNQLIYGPQDYAVIARK